MDEAEKPVIIPTADLEEWQDEELLHLGLEKEAWKLTYQVPGQDVAGNPDAQLQAGIIQGKEEVLESFSKFILSQTTEPPDLET